MNDLVEKRAGSRFDHCVDVIGHDNPSQKPVTFRIEMQQRILHHAGDPRIAQMAGAKRRIERVLDFLAQRRIVGLLLAGIETFDEVCGK